MCVVAGICLIAACVDIYMSGDKPFSAEAVAQRFEVIDIPIYICLASVAVGLLFSMFFPAERKREKGERYSCGYLNSLYAEADLSRCDIGLSYVVKTQRKKRYVLMTILLSLAVIGFLGFCIFAFNGDNYKTDDVNTSVIKLTVAGLICLVPATVFALVREYLLKGIMKTEGDALRKIISDGNVKPKAESGSNYISWVRLALIVLAVGLIAYGFAMGGSNAVLTKAVNLCMECVGLG